MKKNKKIGAKASINQKDRRSSGLFTSLPTAIICTVMAMPLSVQAFASNDIQAVSIKEQSLDTAILQLARQAKATIFVPAELIRGKTSPAVTNAGNLEAALDTLLKNSNLTFQRKSDGAYVVMAKSEVNTLAYATAEDYEKNLTMYSGDQEVNDTVFEEVIVTATKRAQNLQDVPIAISAFSVDQIESLRSSNLRELSGFVPNLYMTPSTERNETTVTLRGLGEGVSRNSGQSVGIYVDGVYVSSATALNLAMMDVERVEVLKGPQGTLFGRDTLGGAINITTREPGNEVSGHIEAETGRFGQHKIQGGVDVPLMEDVLAMRISFQKEKDDGYIRNQYTGRKKGAENTGSARMQLFYSPTDSFSARLAYSHIKSDNRPNSGGEAVTGLYSDLTPYTTNLNGDERAEQDVDTLSLAMDYEFESGFTLTSVSGWSDVEDFYTIDSDFTPFPLIQEEYLGNTKEWSQEIRLTSPEYENYDYMIGAYYLKATNKLSDVYPEMGRNLLLFFEVPEDSIPTDVLDGQKRDYISKSLAFFIHGNYHATEKLTIFGGLRHTSDKKEVDYAFFGETLPLLLGTEPLEAKRDTDDNPLSWTVGARYTFNEDIMGYTSVATGYRSSTIKDYFVSQADLDAASGFFTKPEYVTNYEAGLKMTGFDKRLRTNVSVFYMDYNDIQVSIEQPPYTFIKTLTNAGEATVKGVELDLMAVVTDQFRVTTSFGYLKAVFDEFSPSPGVDYSGENVGGGPALTSSISADYSIFVGSGEVTLHTDYNYRGKTILGPGVESVGPYRDLRGYGVLNAWFGYESQTGWNIALWAKNILDSDDIVNIDNWNSGGPLETDSFMYERPRTYGLTVGYHF